MSVWKKIIGGRKTKLAAVAFLAVLALFSMSAHRANASFFDITATVLNKVVAFFTHIMVTVAALAIAVEAWFINLLLDINDGIVNSPLVKAGFTTSLSLVNLGFVLGIIIIAIATILRSQTYGIKQILWKLVFMAILVNFGLVLGGVLVHFADMLTKFFSGQFKGGFANNFAILFQPQTMLGIAGDKNTSQVASDLAGIATLIFTLITIVAIVIVLATLAVMLLIRYIYLSILFILLPFAWLCWVFPALHENFTKWWRNFIRWALFPPIVLFFLYLVMIMAPKIRHVSQQTQTTSNQQLGNASDAVKQFLKKTFTTLIPIILGDFVLIGLSVGGLIAADSLSIMGASVGIGAVKGAANGVARWASKVPGRAARGAARVATREEPKPTILPKYEKPKGLQHFVNTAQKFEEKLRGSAYKYGPGRAVRAVAGKLPGGPGTEMGRQEAAYEKAEGKVMPQMKPMPVSTAPVTPATVAPGAPSSQPRQPSTPEESIAFLERAKAGGGREGAGAAPTMPQKMSAPAAMEVIPAPAETAGGGRELGEEERRAMEETMRRPGAEIRGGRVEVDNSKLFQRLRDYGEGGKFLKDRPEWEPLKKALSAPFKQGSLLRSIWDGALSGAAGAKGGGIFKKLQRAKEDEKRDQALGEKAANAVLRKGGTPNQAQEAARMMVENDRALRREFRRIEDAVKEDLAANKEGFEKAAEHGGKAPEIDKTAEEMVAEARAKADANLENKSGEET